jgi:hypothetical protein
MNNDELLSMAATHSTERTTEQEIGLIAGMIDDLIITFEFRGLRVRRDGDSMAVSDADTGRELGGRYLLRDANVNAVHDWLTKKATLYGTDMVEA